MASVLVLFNPVSGGGRARRAAPRIERFLRAAGHEATSEPTRQQAGDDWLLERLDGVDALLVLGGDGAVRGVLGAAIRTDTPVYHVPYGTANLFAREFGMSRRRRTLRAALRRFEVRRVDAGHANGEPFVLMASVGFDAEVVHDLTARRGRSISYLSYAGPVLRQLRRWRPAPLQVYVDDRRLTTPGAGLVVVANARHYAFGLNPAPRADMTDGRLDVVYFPVESPRQVVGWIVKCLLRRHERDPRLVRGQGSRVRIECGGPQQVQIDGDPPAGGVGTRVSTLELSVRPRVLPVLVPPS